MEEHFFDCPFYNAPISMLLDASVASQQYIEDCEVCCHSLEINCRFEEAELTMFSAESIEL